MKSSIFIQTFSLILIRFTAYHLLLVVQLLLSPVNDAPRPGVLVPALNHPLLLLPARPVILFNALGLRVVNLGVDGAPVRLPVELQLHVRVVPGARRPHRHHHRPPRRRRRGDGDGRRRGDGRQRLELLHPAHDPVAAADGARVAVRVRAEGARRRARRGSDRHGRLERRDVVVHAGRGGDGLELLQAQTATTAAAAAQHHGRRRVVVMRDGDEARVRVAVPVSERPPRAVARRHDARRRLAAQRVQAVDGETVLPAALSPRALQDLKKEEGTRSIPGRP